MITDACGMAKASLHLLHLSSYLEQAETLQIAAAVLAAHVCDWHYRPKDPTSTDKEAFARDYPEWKSVLAVANGTKHPKARYPQISFADVRPPEWEDDDFWNSNLASNSIFIEIYGHERSLSAIISKFCNEYIVRNQLI